MINLIKHQIVKLYILSKKSTVILKIVFVAFMEFLGDKTLN